MTFNQPISQILHKRVIPSSSGMWWNSDLSTKFPVEKPTADWIKAESFRAYNLYDLILNAREIFGEEWEYLDSSRTIKHYLYNNYINKIVTMISEGKPWEEVEALVLSLLTEKVCQ